MGLVLSEDGSQELKDNGCSDFFLNIGAFQVTMINPNDGDVVVVEMGGQTQILAQNTNGPANYELNGNSYHIVNGTTFYQSSFVSNITEINNVLWLLLKVLVLLKISLFMLMLQLNKQFLKT